jgi:glycogen phosphorylase
MAMPTDATIAYFTMEIALDADMPTYSGGLGVLAGDTVRTAADMGVPMVAVCLVHRKGYFRQALDAEGNQTEMPESWAVEALLEEMPARVNVDLCGREVAVRAWCYWVQGGRGGRVPVLLIDSDLPENTPEDRSLTDALYGGDQRYRLSQEVLLGIGGVRLLRALGFDQIRRFHMNEGHAALLTLELLDEQARGGARESIGAAEIQAVREQCVFTTHTPVPAGHDQFSLELAHQVLDPRPRWLDMEDVLAVDVYRQVLQTREVFSEPRDLLQRGLMVNLTYVALNLSKYINGVAYRHGEVSQLMFADYCVDAITNGVHASTWVAAPMARLFDRHLGDWRADNFSLRYALGIPLDEIGRCHAESKRTLFSYIRASLGSTLDPECLTLGFARRSTEYKRPDLLFHDRDRLRRIVGEQGGLQVVFAGKAHPRDSGGKALIREVHAAARALADDGIRIVYVPDYDTALAKLLVAGVDVWLNTPLPPNEASGTSGMKAAMNGVPSLSTLDGWWIEGHLEGITGWSIGDGWASEDDPDAARVRDADSLYGKLEHSVLPRFYQRRDEFLCMRRQAIALNGSFFNSQRMLQQYLIKAYA